jgi:hypothetical protein
MKAANNDITIFERPTLPGQWQVTPMHTLSANGARLELGFLTFTHLNWGRPE